MCEVKMKCTVHLAKLYFVCFLLLQTISFSQTLSGKVFEVREKNDTSILTGATLHWLGTTIGTSSDTAGNFSLAKTPRSNKLIITYVGLESDTTAIDTTQTFVSFYLSKIK